jgi:hypothetical protein
MERSELIRRIREVAKRRGEGIGSEAFSQEAGISSYELKLHGRWNDLKREAGLATRDFMKPKLPTGQVIEALARIMIRDRAWPTRLDLQRARRRDRSMPDWRVFESVRDEPEFFENLLKLCAERAEFRDLIEVVKSQAAARLDAPPVDVSARVRGYVYMMRSGRRYKIGRTNSPSRRHREVKIDLPDPTSIVHTIETDDPSGIEEYWHKRFAEKRVRETEFFELSQSDVAAFKRRRYM